MVSYGSTPCSGIALGWFLVLTLALAAVFVGGWTNLLKAQSIYDPPYTFNTFAGSAGQSGSTNATGSAARFSSPLGVATDSSGNVYVADSGNYTIRKISSSGVVTTLAGSAGMQGNTDGTGSTARFGAPTLITVDSNENVYVADGGGGGQSIRMITPAGVVTNLQIPDAENRDRGFGKRAVGRFLKLAKEHKAVCAFLRVGNGHGDQLQKNLHIYRSHGWVLLDRKENESYFMYHDLNLG